MLPPKDPPGYSLSAAQARLARARHEYAKKKRKQNRHLPYGARARSVNQYGEPVFHSHGGGPEKGSRLA